MNFDYMQAIRERHSVRSYLSDPIPEASAAALNDEIARCNAISGLSIQLITNESDAFKGFLAHYGMLSGVRNYIALVGPKGPKLDELCGYYGERIVLLAQSLGLNTCWVAGTYSRRKCRAKVEKGQKLVCVIAIGKGKTKGVQSKSKPFNAVCKAEGEMPGWFRAGVECALLAPTAINQQAFSFELIGSNAVLAKAGVGPCANIDLGIVKLHFELGAGKENFAWA
ncbi:MAG: nitroreductase [Clostridia bacterium]|nr:nitroreductase [Clostridia bacterium]